MSAITTKYEFIQSILGTVQPILLALQSRSIGIAPVTDQRPPPSLMNVLRHLMNIALKALQELIRLVDRTQGAELADGIRKLEEVREKVLRADETAGRMASMAKLGILKLPSDM